MILSLQDDALASLHSLKDLWVYLLIFARYGKALSWSVFKGGSTQMGWRKFLLMLFADYGISSRCKNHNFYLTRSRSTLQVYAYAIWCILFVDIWRLTRLQISNIPPLLHCTIWKEFSWTRTKSRSYQEMHLSGTVGSLNCKFNSNHYLHTEDSRYQASRTTSLSLVSARSTSVMFPDE